MKTTKDTVSMDVLKQLMALMDSKTMSSMKPDEATPADEADPSISTDGTTPKVKGMSITIVKPMKAKSGSKEDFLSKLFGKA